MSVNDELVIEYGYIVKLHVTQQYSENAQDDKIDDCPSGVIQGGIPFHYMPNNRLPSSDILS
ncbi:hypothetical protein GCM10027049_11030 [Mucilaginibacter puniceus]